jgi:hypothetical protein
MGTTTQTTFRVVLGGLAKKKIEEMMLCSGDERRDTGERRKLVVAEHISSIFSRGRRRSAVIIGYGRFIGQTKVFGGFG